MLLTIDVEFRPAASASEVAQSIDDIERRIKRRFPFIERIYIEAVEAVEAPGGRGPACAGLRVGAGLDMLGHPMGHRRWVIADGYIPARSHGPAPEMASHEAACLLNTADEDALVSLTIYFSDREPCGPYRVTVPARRTRHVRLNDLDDPEPIPRATDYACVIESDRPIVVQHTRLDSRQAENALFSTIAFPA